MSSIISPSLSSPATRSVRAGRIALAGLCATVAAVIAIALVYALGSVAVSYRPEFSALATPVPAIMFTLIAGIGATLVYALVLARARNPVRTFRIIALVVLLVSLVPDLAMLATPGATGGQVAVLMTMHLVAAVVLTGFLTVIARPA